MNIFPTYNKIHTTFKRVAFGRMPIRNSTTGFTLVELIVSVGIFVFLTTVVLVNHGRFSSAILLENLAYDIALSIREAQVYGLSVREFEPGSGEFQPGYGVHFNKSAPTSYILFADRNNNLQYDPGIPCGVSGSECIQTYTIGRGNYITQFCATLPSGTARCTPALDYVNLVYVRPNPDAIITSNFGGEQYSDATVTVSSPQGAERTVVARITGQVSIPQ